MAGVTDTGNLCANEVAQRVSRFLPPRFLVDGTVGSMWHSQAMKELILTG